MSSGTTYHSEGEKTSHFELEIWHPKCWTLRATSGTDAGLVARGVYVIDGDIHARVTTYGESTDAVDQLVGAVRESPLTDAVRRLTPRLEPSAPAVPRGKATRELLVEYPDTNSIYEPFIEHRFVPDEAIHIRDGKEYWRVVIDADREEIRRRLDAISSEMDADIAVRSIGSEGGIGIDRRPLGALSPRQREAVELACGRGYYEWPRETTADELAAEFGVSKATFLEHLRKAESKLLGACVPASDEW